MNINISLSTEGIAAAIHKLRNVKENLRWGLDETIDTLVKEGTLIAQAADGSMAAVTGYRPDETTGMIIVTGDAAAIAEFGAGDATEVPTGFENIPDTPVYPGSYSEEHAQMYSELGWWRFGGRIYRQVEPRHGLMQAKVYVLEEGTDVAKEVIKL